MITTIIIIIAVAFLLILIFRKKGSSNETLKSIANLNDNTLSDNEKKVANIFKQIVEVVQDDPNTKYYPDLNYTATIDEIALEVFKCGMWRLKNKDLANHYFRNHGYIETNKQRFIDDANKKIDEKYFISLSKPMFEKYILDWVIEFRDMAKHVNNFLS